MGTYNCPNSSSSPQTPGTHMITYTCAAYNRPNSSSSSQTPRTHMITYACAGKTHIYLKKTIKRFFRSFVLFLTKANRKECRERLQEADSTVYLVLPKLNRKRTLMKADEGGTEQRLRLNHSACCLRGETFLLKCEQRRTGPHPR